jgi:hypothetical protein
MTLIINLNEYVKFFDIKFSQSAGIHKPDEKITVIYQPSTVRLIPASLYLHKRQREEGCRRAFVTSVFERK